MKIIEELKAIDNSDKFELTRQYCSAAMPTLECKQKTWDLLHGPDADKLSLYGIGELVSGFRQQSQRDLLANFVDAFFANIRNVVNKKARSVSEQYFFSLRPSMEASPKEISMFESFM